jgi:two-component system, OmpR family, phosphate regulon response regulator PhoB
VDLPFTDALLISPFWFPGPEGVKVSIPSIPPPGRWRLATGKGGPTYVLLIEDDPSIADMYRVQLEHDGYRVGIAPTAEVALSTLSEESPDIVLLDLLLPDRSGFEMLAALNERFPNHPPVVILSNYGEPSMIDRGRSLGAVEYLVKSRVTPSEISAQIPAWIAHGRRGRQGES